VPAARVGLILLPVPDGSERADGQAAGSGAAVTAALRDALLMRGFRVEVSEGSSLRDAQEHAARTGFFAYVLKGAITEWEDNATEWSSRPDSAAFSLELHEVRRGIVATATHRIVASTVAALSRGPDRFVPELVDHAVAKMFGGTPRVYTER